MNLQIRRFPSTTILKIMEHTVDNLLVSMLVFRIGINILSRTMNLLNMMSGLEVRHVCPCVND